jgi:hypothetical protein
MARGENQSLQRKLTDRPRERWKRRNEGNVRPHSHPQLPSIHIHRSFRSEVQKALIPSGREACRIAYRSFFFSKDFEGMWVARSEEPVGSLPFRFVTTADERPILNVDVHNLPLSLRHRRRYSHRPSDENSAEIYRAASPDDQWIQQTLTQPIERRIYFVSNPVFALTILFSLTRGQSSAGKSKFIPVKNGLRGTMRAILSSGEIPISDKR